MDAKLRKKHILECAKKLFSKKGYYNTQISDIIQEANIARGTVYQYFKNKDDIFITLLEDFYKQWEDVAIKDMGDLTSKGLTHYNYLRNRVKNTLHFFANDHDLSNIVLRVAPGLGGNFESPIKRLENKIKLIISNDLQFGINNKNVKDTIDIELTANLLGGGILRVAFYNFVKKKNQKEYQDIEKLASQIVDIFASGIFFHEKVID
ncbi:MAG: TetR/AcrR family transcriptional regulator [bacterium]|nr:TetR/AcrR family transcriptional regulator [bacterium]